MGGQRLHGGLRALILTAGALGDRIGARRVFVAGFGVFTAASAARGLAPGLGVLVAAHAVQGIGAAALVPCSLARVLRVDLRAQPLVPGPARLHRAADGARVRAQHDRGHGRQLPAGRVAARVGPAATIAAGSLLVAAGLAALLVVGSETPYPALVAQLVVVGLGLGLVVPVMTSSLLGSVDPSFSGVALFAGLARSVSAGPS